jgi:hypothetical protein
MKDKTTDDKLLSVLETIGLLEFMKQGQMKKISEKYNVQR